MSQNKEIVVDVTSEQHAKQLADGLTEDEILKPGRHIFRRGGFHERHPNFSSSESKVRVTIEMDADVLRYFQKRAERSNAETYDEEINAELRAAMQRDAA